MLALAALATTAHARHVEFVSPHPVPHKFGGGFCYIEVPHVHNYPPGDPRMYREVHGQHYFVGDPAPFGYEGPRYAYYGAHPVVEAELRLGHPVFCYIKGAHFHWYQAPPHAHFELSGGAYWYVGAFPQAYWDDRPRFAVINEAYTPLPYARPVVDIAVAPPLVRADISFGGPGWAAHAVVGGPPAPVPLPPPPVQVGVGINVGGPAVIVDHDHGPHGRIHHDHGRHEGGRNGPHVERGPHGRPSRYIVGPAPVREPLLRQGRGPAPMSRATPAPRTGPAPGPQRSPTQAGAPTRGAASAAAPTRGPAPAAAPTRGAAPAPRLQPLKAARGQANDQRRH
jgi:hypothetical protein